MGSKSTRRKGIDYEQEVARKVTAALGVEARRGYQRVGGDVEPDVVGLDGWSPECKYGQRAKLPFDLEEGWQQAMAGEGRPLLVFRRQRAESRVVLRLDDFLELLRLAGENGDER